jgi:hypothetical protein
MQTILVRQYLHASIGDEQQSSDQNNQHDPLHTARAALWASIMQRALSFLAPATVSEVLTTIQQTTGLPPETIQQVIMLTVVYQSFGVTGNQKNRLAINSNIAEIELQQIGLTRQQAAYFSKAIQFKDDPQQYQKALQLMGVSQTSYQAFDYIRKIIFLSDHLDTMRMVSQYDPQVILKNLSEISGLRDIQEHPEIIITLIGGIHQFIYDQGEMDVDCEVLGTPFKLHALKLHPPFSSHSAVKYLKKKNIFRTTRRAALKNKVLRQYLDDITTTKEELIKKPEASLMQGETSPVLQSLLKTGIKWAAFAVLGVVAFSIMTFVGGAPLVVTAFIDAWFAGSVIYLSGLGYGIVNDMIACRKNLPYFLLGHQPGQRSIIKSNDPNANAVAWGILATFGLSFIAAIVFAIPVLIMGLAGLPFAGFVLPIIGLGIPLALFLAHRFADNYVKNIPTLKQGQKDQCIDNLDLDVYQKNRLKIWLKDTKDLKNWISNSARNGFGYLVMPLLGIAGLVSIITCSALGHALPIVLIGTAASAFPPAGLALLLATVLIAACLYLYFNRNKTVNSNPYILNYNQEEKDNDTLQESEIQTYPTCTILRKINHTQSLPELATPAVMPSAAAIISASPDVLRPIRRTQSLTDLSQVNDAEVRAHIKNRRR